MTYTTMDDHGCLRHHQVLPSACSSSWSGNELDEDFEDDNHPLKIYLSDSSLSSNEVIYCNLTEQFMFM